MTQNSDPQSPEKYLCGCCIIHDDVVASYDCCGRVFHQNITPKTNIDNIHPNDLKELMISQITNMIKYHQDESNLVCQYDQIDSALMNLKFVSTISESQKNSRQRIRIFDNFYANLFFGLQKN
jgi:hypothetical protein